VKLNLLLVASAAVYGVSGLALTFAPAELLAALGASPSAAPLVLAQLLGAALLALATLDWLQRYATVGGILGRPVLLANLIFALPGFLSALRAWRHDGGAPLLTIACVLGAFTAAFGMRLLGWGGAPQGRARADAA